MIKWSCNFLLGAHGNSPSCQFGGHRHWWRRYNGFSMSRHCGSADIKFLVVEEQDSTCSRLNLPLLFISKAHGMLWSHTRNFYSKGNSDKNICKCANEWVQSWSRASCVTSHEQKKFASQLKKSAGKDKKKKRERLLLSFFEIS